MDLDVWIDSYARAWETADEELIASLFTKDASYRSVPSASRAGGTTRSARSGAGRPAISVRRGVRMGRPFADGSRVAVEWWTTMIEDGEEAPPCPAVCCCA